jgi:hypothetical protein
MRSELDPKIADRLVSSAVFGLRLPARDKVLCTRRALEQAFLEVAQKAHEIGFLAGREIRFRNKTLSGSAERQAWMDMRLDDAAALATCGLRLRRVVVRSLLGAGYQSLGDLRWLSGPQLTRLFYVGLKTVRQIRNTVERLEREER